MLYLIASYLKRSNLYIPLPKSFLHSLLHFWKPAALHFIFH